MDTEKDKNIKIERSEYVSKLYEAYLKDKEEEEKGRKKAEDMKYVLNIFAGLAGRKIS